MQDLTGKVTRTEQYYFAHGGLADIWKGEWNTGNTIEVVAIKVIRSAWNDPEYVTRLNEKLFREGSVWSRLNHPNITPFFGVCSGVGRQPTSLICPYYSNGDVSKFLQQHPEVDRMQLVTQVASGLTYLHGFQPNPIIHGDIKASNILINDRNEASITDFGLSRILETSGFTTKTTAGTCRWMAYELIAPNDNSDEDSNTTSVTKATDVWAFAMTVIEILTGRLPFSHIKYDSAVVLSIMRNGRPLRQTNPEIADEVWSVLSRCWANDEHARPSMQSLALFFDICHWFKSLNRRLADTEIDRILDVGAVKMSSGQQGGQHWRTPPEHIQQPLDASPYHCHWPGCQDGFDTLRGCQEHEATQHSKHWDLVD